MKAQDLFEKVTADLITAIEDGASGWRMPWQCLAGGTPTSVDGAAVPWVEHDGVGDGRRRSRMAVEPVGHLPGVATSRLSGAPRRARHTSRVVEAHRATAGGRVRREGAAVLSIADRPGLHRLRRRTGRRIRPVRPATRRGRSRGSTRRRRGLLSSVGAHVVIGGDRACARADAR